MTPNAPPPSRRLAGELRAAVVKKFWDSRAELFVNNLPWLAEEKKTTLLRPLAGHGGPVRPMSGR